jgi:hypothetical protein
VSKQTVGFTQMVSSCILHEVTALAACIVQWHASDMYIQCCVDLGPAWIPEGMPDPIKVI